MLDTFLDTLPPAIISNISEMDLGISSANCNKAIDNLLRRSVLVGGKRLRPLLTHLMGAVFGLTPDRVQPYAKAIELVHAASLSHDDVVDNASKRRGAPSINSLSSNKYAVLAGDYLLADVIDQLTLMGNNSLLQEMASVIKDLAEGEWLQLDASVSREYNFKIIEQIALKKTASVMSYCCVAPAILAECDQNRVDRARQFGINIGLAFQLIDDTLDFADNKQKDFVADLENGLINSVLFKWLELNPNLYTSYQNGANLSEIFNKNRLDESIQFVRSHAENKLNEARALLDAMVADRATLDMTEDVSSHLHQIIDFMEKREN